MNKKKRLWQTVTDFFADSSPFMTLVGKFAFLVMANVCWVLCSLPVVTAGAATAALYAVLEQRESLSYLSVVPAFVRSLRRLWKTATLLWLPFLLLGVLFVMDLWLLLVRQLTNNVLLLTPLLVAAALWAMTLVWLFPLAASRSAAPGVLLRQAFLLGLGELLRSAAAVVLFLIPPLLYLFVPAVFRITFPLWALSGFSLPARLALSLMEPVLKKQS